MVPPKEIRNSKDKPLGPRHTALWGQNGRRGIRFPSPCCLAGAEGPACPSGLPMGAAASEVKSQAASPACSGLGLRVGGSDVSEFSLICLEIRHKSSAKQEAVSSGLT